MSTNFSFDNNDPTPYLIIFDNVLHTGQMACNSVAGHTIWFVNGSSTSIQEGCQNLLIPVEKIDKQSPAPFAAIGVPFTYTLTIPVLCFAKAQSVIGVQFDSCHFGFLIFSFLLFFPITFSPNCNCQLGK
jgi:hypothetical protein